MQFIPAIERLNAGGVSLCQEGTTVSERSVLPEQFGNFLSTIFDEWVKHLDGYNLLPFLKGEVKKSPRVEYFYFSDDGALMARRQGGSSPGPQPKALVLRGKARACPHAGRTFWPRLG